MATSNGGGMEVDQTGEKSQTYARLWPELYNNTQEYPIIHKLAKYAFTDFSNLYISMFCQTTQARAVADWLTFTQVSLWLDKNANSPASRSESALWLADFDSLQP